MNVWIASGIIIVTFFFMEFMAWFTHKYVMHGFLWVLHKDHHQEEPGFFEKNDAFFLIFAVPSFLLILFGTLGNFDFRFFIGIGIAVYGLCYFLVHDVFIHRRFKWFKGTRNPYMKALLRAHHQHHVHKGKEEGECFGMLVVPQKFYQKAFKRRS